MTADSTPDLAVLRALAREALSDGWHNADYLRCFINGDDEQEFSDADTAYIAAADPATILRLIELAELGVAWEAAEAALPFIDGHQPTPAEDRPPTRRGLTTPCICGRTLEPVSPFRAKPGDGLIWRHRRVTGSRAAALRALTAALAGRSAET